MAYQLKWGDRTWLYALAMGLGIGMAILLFMHNMVGKEFFFNYYSPMLGYYVLISICQSHYFRRPPEPRMSGLFRQFVSIFGAVVIFFVNQLIMIDVLGVPQPAHPLLYHGDLIMSGHFTFIVFGFFIYGFDDFMFKGKLVSWIKNDLAKAVFWYFVIWLIWLPLYYLKGGIVEAYSAGSYDAYKLFRMLAISQWTIIMSLMIALTFKDYLPEIRIENDYLKGLLLLGGSFLIGGAIAYICYGLTDYVAPWGDISATDKWHHVLYMGTYPLTPVILMGVYTGNLSSIENPQKRVALRLLYLVPIIVLSYFAFHLLIAQPELVPNWLFPDSFRDGMGLFGAQKGWHHHLDLYFNFTVSIIPLTHHWFCGKAGFVEEAEEGKEGRRTFARPSSIPEGRTVTQAKRESRSGPFPPGPAGQVRRAPPPGWR